MRLFLLSIVLLSYSAIADSYSSLFEARRGWFNERNILDSAIKENGQPKYVNSLIAAESPYLLSHSLQPVNWLQWQASFEQVFASENKLIFISIGYATCHWCHVMAQESFNSEAVAAMLNRHFVSIKVDREQWPLVDNRYKLALELLKGEAGWPINVILTPQGKVIWADSYLPESQFVKVISALGQRWQTSPESLLAVADRISAQLVTPLNPVSPNHLDPNVVIRELNAKRLKTLADEARRSGPRFLREYWLLGLLEQYLAYGDERIIDVVTQHVDTILLSPTYDAIEGGFHRYAVDGLWQQPHFEKMLYTQAFMVKVLARLYLITAKPQYLAAMEQTINWVDSFLYQPYGRSSAMSAISDGGEGSYYRFIETDQALLSDAGFNFYANSQPNLVALANLDMDWRDNQWHRKLVALRRQNVAPQVDEKIIVSWNAMYIDALVDAYQVTNNEQFLATASDIADQLWQMARRNNKLHRIVFQGRASIEATSEDYAWFAKALLNLSLYKTQYQSNLVQHTSAEHANRFSIRERAVWLLDALVKDYRFETLQELSNDGELPSVYSSVYQAMALGRRNLGSKEYRTIADQLIKNHSSKSNDIEDNYSFWAAAAQQTDSPVLRASYFAKGHGKVSLIRRGDHLEVRLDLESGWHVNANPSTNEELIATEVEVVGDTAAFEIGYPGPQLRQLGFSQSLLKLYDDQTSILLRPTSTSSVNISGLTKVKVRLQACSDKLCLLPETIILLL